MKLSTGVLVLYADDESFTLMTPEGHMLAGWITFSAEARDGVTVVQIQALERTNDPLYELGYVLGGNRLNSRFWIQTAENLARHLGVERGRLPGRRPRRRVGKAGNLADTAVRTFVGPSAPRSAGCAGPSPGGPPATRGLGGRPAGACGGWPRP